jgi:hypothetical protein
MSSLQDKRRREELYASQIDEAVQNHDLDRFLSLYRQASLDLRKGEITPMIEGHLAKVRREMYGLGYKPDALDYFVNTGKLPTFSSSGTTSAKQPTVARQPQPPPKAEKKSEPLWLKILFVIIVLFVLSKGCD